MKPLFPGRREFFEQFTRLAAGGWLSGRSSFSEVDGSRMDAAVLRQRRLADAEQRLHDGAMNVRHAPFGARGDGVHDDSGAVRLALAAAIDAAGPGRNAAVFFPPGRYRIDAGALLSDIGVRNALGVNFLGAGSRASQLVLHPAGRSRWLYDNAGTARMQSAAFSDLEFTSDDPALGNGFRVWSDGHEQAFVFERCSFRDLGTCFQLTGRANASEMRFYACKFYDVTDVYVLDNAQSVNHEFFGCDMERVRGDLFQVLGGGGGSVRMFGGSLIWGERPPGVRFAHPDSYLVRATGTGNLGPGNMDFSFYGVRTEARTAIARLVKCTEQQGGISVGFHRCNLTVSGGGARDVVWISAMKEVLFDSSLLSGDFRYLIDTPARLAPGFASAGLVGFVRCYVPAELASHVRAAHGYGRAYARDCHLMDAAPADNRAVDFDLNWQNATRGDVGVALKAAVLKPALADFPVRGGLESTVVLPPGAVIRGIHVLKPANAGVPETPYQLVVGNGDRSAVYGRSAAGSYRGQHTVRVADLFHDVGSTLTGRTVRLWAETGATAAHSGGHALVEYY